MISGLNYKYYFTSENRLDPRQAFWNKGDSLFKSHTVPIYFTKDKST